RLKVRWMD
ncbi:putative host specificity protein, partial [Escherichia coli EC1735]